MEHPTVFPSLVYDDANATLGFLTAAFGAERHAAYGGDGTIHHAELRFGNGIVMFGSSRPDAPATRGGGGGIYVVVIDPDAHCARARDAGAEILREPFDTDYGSRDYSAKDPEGNAGTSAPTSPSRSTTKWRRRRGRPSSLLPTYESRN